MQMHNEDYKICRVVTQTHIHSRVVSMFQIYSWFTANVQTSVSHSAKTGGATKLQYLYKFSGSTRKQQRV